MLTFDWNGLRLGDHVLVHASSGADMALSPGTVAMVEVGKGSNGVGVRMTTDSRGPVVWPSRLAVHRDPCDSAEPCWRCQVLSEAAEVPTTDAHEPARLAL